MTRRREYLSATGALAASAIGGCLGSFGEGTGSGIDTELNDRVEVDIPVSFTVEEISSRLDSEELPRFTITMTN